MKVLSQTRPQEVRVLARQPDTLWQRVRVRPTERGWLEVEFAVRQIWTVAIDQPARLEWLVLRREADGDLVFSGTRTVPMVAGAEQTLVFDGIPVRAAGRHLLLASALAGDAAESELGLDAEGTCAA